jgi:hypothetical protein
MRKVIDGRTYCAKTDKRVQTDCNICVIDKEFTTIEFEPRGDSNYALRVGERRSKPARVRLGKEMWLKLGSPQWVKFNINKATDMILIQKCSEADKGSIPVKNGKRKCRTLYRASLARFILSFSKAANKYIISDYTYDGELNGVIINSQPT